MATTKKQNTETKTQELSDVELSRASGGIIAVLQQKAQMCDGSVAPAPTTTPVQRSGFGIFGI